ncbi:hypothetical protein ALDI51_21260 [Alicycliphilus denitrificans]|uniref:Bug family tripartite tricarboxylate transporter substrate binding protein n=1 Tax=Alicycliphilus denitrificans TaxID=179636 RepID=UPI00095FFC4B|nr:tripartite tricarboxylate transporter substrate binding protein [Alicycliphilus denitrificans]MBN9573702.1 tripartite tricarboxylate transporter substrate binding protein [Alicycliphilus denitrificans]OJW90403.1 MAG: hypothetical protein BGO66_05265 [Alicycliphilus sp. 69-12]BCN38807.1 hypothetical protein ALDI51_21260 [Alicycliphilus denitrificans]
MKSLSKLLGAVSLCALTTVVQAQAKFPSKTVRIVVPFGTGAMIDIIPRDFGNKLQEKWGVPVIVENRPGAASMLGAEYVAKAPADGYTLLMASSSTLSAAPFLYKNLRFDPLKDLVPVTLVSDAPSILLVSPQLPVNNLKEFVALAKSKPGEMSYASAGVGGIIHLQTEYFQGLTGIKMIHTPYVGSQQAVADLTSNRVQMMIDILASNTGNLQGKLLKPLASLTQQRLPQLPDVPTATEAGYPMVTGIWFGMAAPRGTPAEVIDKIQKDISAIINEPAFKKKYEDQGMYMIGNTPAEMQKIVSTEAERWKKVIQDARISIE